MEVKRIFKALCFLFRVRMAPALLYIQTVYSISQTISRIYDKRYQKYCNYCPC